MPKALHRKLMLQAIEKGLSGEKKNSYVYGTLQEIEKKMGKK